MGPSQRRLRYLILLAFALFGCRGGCLFSEVEPIRCGPIYLDEPPECPDSPVSDGWSCYAYSRGTICSWGPRASCECDGVEWDCDPTQGVDLSASTPDLSSAPDLREVDAGEGDGGSDDGGEVMDEPLPE